jgi:hypothetical protein
MLISATFAAVGMSAATSEAQTVAWNGTGVQYDNGASFPSVAMTVAQNYGTYYQTEVHQGESPDLWDHGGAYPNFNGSNWYTTGFYPAIASNGDGLLLEVHQGGTDPNSLLWFGMGLQNGSLSLGNLTSSGQGGFFPTVAVVRNRLSIVEAHQGQQTQGPLWMNMTYGNEGWETTQPWVAIQYNWGAKPSISVWPVSPSGGNTYYIMEVHQGGDTNGLLWSDFGIITDNLFSNGSWSVKWLATSQYTGGVLPSVAICNNHDVIAVNEGANGSLWSHTGVITTDSQGNHSFHWIPGTDQAYDNGYAPKVSCTSPMSNTDEQAQGMEVHEGQDGPGTVWRHAFTMNP